MLTIVDPWGYPLDLRCLYGVYVRFFSFTFHTHSCGRKIHLLGTEGISVNNSMIDVGRTSTGYFSCLGHVEYI